MADLTEFNEIMAGMEEVYADEERRLNEMAPRCHVRPMFLDEDDYETWWECSFCGHTKRCGAGVLA